MKVRMITAAVLACLGVATAWIVQIQYGIGSCGPASNTPTLSVIFGMGPFYYLASIEPFSGIIDALPTAVALGIMFLIPIAALFAVIFGMLTVGGMLGRRLASRGTK